MVRSQFTVKGDELKGGQAERRITDIGDWMSDVEK
jgi:hypothetical protein